MSAATPVAPAPSVSAAATPVAPALTRSKSTLAAADNETMALARAYDTFFTEGEATVETTQKHTWWFFLEVLKKHGVKTDPTSFIPRGAIQCRGLPTQKEGASGGNAPSTASLTGVFYEYTHGGSVAYAANTPRKISVFGGLYQEDTDKVVAPFPELGLDVPDKQKTVLRMYDQMCTAVAARAATSAAATVPLTPLAAITHGVTCSPGAGEVFRVKEEVTNILAHKLAVFVDHLDGSILHDDNVASAVAQIQSGDTWQKAVVAANESNYFSAPRYTAIALLNTPTTVQFPEVEGNVEMAKKLEFRGKMTMWAAVYDTFKSLSNTAVGKIVTTRHDLSTPAQTTVTVTMLDDDASLFDKASAALAYYSVLALCMAGHAFFAGSNKEKLSAVACNKKDAIGEEMHLTKKGAAMLQDRLHLLCAVPSKGRKHKVTGEVGPTTYTMVYGAPAEALDGVAQYRRPEHTVNVPQVKKFKDMNGTKITTTLQQGHTETFATEWVPGYRLKTCYPFSTYTAPVFEVIQERMSTHGPPPSKRSKTTDTTEDASSASSASSTSKKDGVVLPAQLAELFPDGVPPSLVRGTVTAVWRGNTPEEIELLMQVGDRLTTHAFDTTSSSFVEIPAPPMWLETCRQKLH